MSLPGAGTVCSQFSPLKMSAAQTEFNTNTRSNAEQGFGGQGQKGVGLESHARWEPRLVTTGNPLRLTRIIAAILQEAWKVVKSPQL